MSTVSQKVTVVPAITGEIDLNNSIHVLPTSLQPWKPGIFSYSSSLLSTVSGFPLDSVKTRMQTHHFNGIFDCIKKTIKHEGIQGLFRGVTAPLLSSSITKALGVSVYTAAKPYASLLQKYTIRPINYDDHSTKWKKAMILGLNNAPVSFAAGVVSGIACSTFACPFEFTKLFQQLYVLMQGELGLNPRTMPKTTYQVAKAIRRSQGFRGLYSGFRFHLLRDSIGSGLYFSVYETAKILIDGLSDDKGKISGTNIPIGTISITLAGACSGVFSWILVFPFDTVKSLTQRDIVLNIIRGLASKKPEPIMVRKLSLPTRDMYRGLSVSIARSVITSVTFFSCFEYLMKHIT